MEVRVLALEAHESAVAVPVAVPGLAAVLRAAVTRGEVEPRVVGHDVPGFVAHVRKGIKAMRAQTCINHVYVELALTFSKGYKE